MPIQLAPDFYKNQVLDRISIKFNRALPRDTVMIIGHLSAAVAVDGKVHTFEWDSEGFYPHGLKLNGLREVEVEG